MSRRASSSRPARALRAVLVALVAAGYLVALGTTAAGEGLTLVPHLALDHAGTLAPPTLVEEASADGEVLTTLRPEARGHTHGGTAHTHPPAPAWPTVRVGAEAPQAADDGWHTHGDETHRHLPEAPAPEALVVVSLDKHRLPVPPGFAMPAAIAVAWPTIETTTAASVAPSVETPPPIGRG